MLVEPAPERLAALAMVFERVGRSAAELWDEVTHEELEVAHRLLQPATTFTRTAAERLADEGHGTGRGRGRRPRSRTDQRSRRAEEEPMTERGDEERARDDEPDAAAGGAGAPPRPEAPNRAPAVTREYATDRITVQWYAERCIHSANCIRALPRVFDPRRRPWVDVHAAEADEIARAVLRCPTGALHFVRHDGGAQETPDVPTSLTPIRHGPLYVRGDVEVRGLDGRVIRRGTRVSLCRCGLARQMPFCDNTCRQERWREPSGTAAGGGPTGGPESAPPSS